MKGMVCDSSGSIYGDARRGGDAAPLEACCAAVKNLQALAPTSADRRATCERIKTAAARCPNIKDDAASSLPQKCGIQLNIPISKTTDSSTKMKDESPRELRDKEKSINGFSICINYLQ
ncbi:non-specific lipid-transfer protein A [Manihot esculenta]|uniref:non-specific lipid-transfer protein A n=1 Tax=Manihot esculenta TaxID=3983 RepID=UPI000B5D85D7|nr:non-specific lipid-transfer protein A [Manihot esculenta]